MLHLKLYSEKHKLYRGTLPERTWIIFNHMFITEFLIAEFKPVNRCSQLTCVHPCCHPIHIMCWFIQEAAIVLFVDTPLHSIPRAKWHNLWTAPSQMNLQVILIEWQKGCKHIHVSWFAYVIWSANVVGNVDRLTACSMTVCMCSILTCDHNDENFSFSFHQCLMHIFFKQKSRKCTQDLWHKTKNSEHI